MKKLFGDTKNINNIFYILHCFNKMRVNPIEFKEIFESKW